MNIEFMSQHKFQTVYNVLSSELEETAVISIVTEQQDTYQLNNNFLFTLQLVFEDSETSFTREQAKTIIEFADKCKNSSCKQILVHCLAGVSRSSAISLFLEEYLNNLIIEDIQRSKFNLHNRYVYSTLNKLLQGY